MVGILLLLFCSAAIALNDFNSQILTSWRWITGILALFSLILLIYTLFGAIPFKKTYIEYERNTVVYTGIYALCRHPGVLWFFFFYLFLGFTLESKLMLIAALVWTCMDLVYVFIQDRWIFPITLENYQDYKKEVPFLIPNLTSFLSFIHYYWGKVSE
jgi:protein-S-isoprenylcysteine O-methyltransferase Ste14